MSTPQAHPDLTPEDIARLEAKLEKERATILERSKARASEALAEQLQLPDESDQASIHSSQTLELKLAGKDRNLLIRIDHALEKIRRGEYGLCEGTDEPIEPRRLEARPWALQPGSQRAARARALHARRLTEVHQSQVELCVQRGRGFHDELCRLLLLEATGASSNDRHRQALDSSIDGD